MPLNVYQTTDYSLMPSPGQLRAAVVSPSSSGCRRLPASPRMAYTIYNQSIPYSGAHFLSVLVRHRYPKFSPSSPPAHPVPLLPARQSLSLIQHVQHTPASASFDRARFHTTRPLPHDDAACRAADHLLKLTPGTDMNLPGVSPQPPSARIPANTYVYTEMKIKLGNPIHYHCLILNYLKPVFSNI